MKRNFNFVTRIHSLVKKNEILTTRSDNTEKRELFVCLVKGRL